jgi:hypothetical protein
MARGQLYSCAAGRIQILNLLCFHRPVLQAGFFAQIALAVDALLRRLDESARIQQLDGS